jgi:hypothetical protein
MAFTRERALVDDLTDQLQQPLVGDLRSRPTLGEPDHDAGFVVDRGRLAGVDL